MGGPFIFAVLAGLALMVLFAPLAAVLVAAAKTGRGSILSWAICGSQAVALLWLAGAYGLREAGYPLGALWFLVSAPWASARAAIWAWRSARQREKRAEGAGAPAPTR